MRVSNVALSLMTRFKTVDGKSFYGQIFAPIDYMPLDNFSAPRRMMRTTAKAAIGVGTVFLTNTGRRYLMARHADSDTPRLLARTFRLFEVDRELPWKRLITVTDPVTELKTDSGLQDLGTIYCSLENPHVEEDKLNIPKPWYRIATNAAIQLGDRIDNMKVRRVWDQLGVRFAEIE